MMGKPSGFEAQNKPNISRCLGFGAGLILSSTLLFSSCASTDHGQRSANYKVTDKASIEAGLSLESDRVEDELSKSGAIIHDPSLNSYVKGLTSKIVGEYEGQLRVYLAEAPVFNAGILPNGAMVIYSGLMLRAESEAQLALVLGHEFGHYLENHSVERHAAASNATVGSLAFGIATGGYGNLVGSLVALSQFTAFSREQEIESDIIGLQKVESLGYDGNNAIQIWTNLTEEREKSTNDKVRKNTARSPIFSTHPNSADRMEIMEQRVSVASGETGHRAYRAKIRPFLQPWLAAELSQRDYGSTLALIDRLSEQGTDLGVLGYMRGRVYAVRSEDGDQQKAVQAYIEGSTHADAPALLWRDLGDIYEEQGNSAKAVRAFRDYLSKAPNAEDRSLIEFMITSLEG